MNQSAWATSAFVGILLAFWGCTQQPINALAPVGGDGGGIVDDGYLTGKELFDQQVYPIFSSRCTPCHSLGHNDAPVWMGLDVTTSYARIEAYPKLFIVYPENSWFLLKGEHTGPALLADEIAIISNWLNTEVNERGFVGEEYYAPEGSGGGGPGDPSAITLFDALAQFGQCMTFEDWQNTKMVNLPDQQTSAGACKSCHFAGMGGNFLSNDPTNTFSNNQTFPFILKIAVGTVDENGAFSDLVAAKRHIDKGIESQNCNQEPCHPAFTLSPEMETAVNEFFSLTYDRWKQGLCGP